jgi:calcineurin-like phosphoesterase family protein
MSDIWFIADTHFNHKKLLEFRTTEGKPIRDFDKIEHMDEHIIECWNSVVKPNDIVWHLGDVVYSDNPMLWMEENFYKLNGIKKLVIGNHDRIPLLCSYFTESRLWMLDTNLRVILSHVPIHQSCAHMFGSKDKGILKNPLPLLNVHGHIHENPSPPGPYQCVSVEHINYTPINVDQLKMELLQKTG